VSAVSTLLAQSARPPMRRPAIRYPDPHADVAQLVEHQLPKLGVAGSNPVVRSGFAGHRESRCYLGATKDHGATSNARSLASRAIWA
jgi:hypothetical protein